MDEREEMRGDGRQSAVPPVPPMDHDIGGGHPYRRKLIRPEREKQENGREGQGFPASRAPERGYSGAGGAPGGERGGAGSVSGGRLEERADSESGRTGNGEAERTAAADGSSGNGEAERTAEADGRSVMKTVTYLRTESGYGRHRTRRPRLLARGKDERAQAREGTDRNGALRGRPQREGQPPQGVQPPQGAQLPQAVQPPQGFQQQGGHPSQDRPPQDRQQQDGQPPREAPALQEERLSRSAKTHPDGLAQRQAEPRRNGRAQPDQPRPQAGTPRLKAPASPTDRPRRQEQPEQQARSSPQDRSGTGDKQPIPASLDDVKPLLEREAGLNASFDAVLREMTFGGRRTALFYMNGLVNSAVLTEVLVRMSYLTSEDLDADVLKLFFETYVPAIQVTKTDSFDDMLDAVFAGNAAMFIDRENAALIIDVKQFPDRTPEEPSLERVVRGARDGFVETLMTNVSLIRRRLRDKDLRYELIRVGARTKTDVCIAYIRDIADPELVEEVKRKIGQVNVYGLPLADKQLEETTVNLGWHPYPLVRYSERPDVVAAQLLEGSVAVLTDTTPSVMMLPTTFFDLTQHAEENRQTPFIGTYLRWVRYIGILFSLFLLPLWFLLVLKPELKPPELDFIGPQEQGRIPLFLQFVLAEIGVDLMRMAAVHTPSPLSTAMSLIAAILIGDIAVKTGLFNNEVILYMAVAAIGMFATPNYELGLANRIVRLALIIAVALYGVPGFVVGTALFIVLLACTRSFNRPYLWPFIPFDGRSLAALLVRPPELQNKKRNPLLKPQQMDRLPDTQGGGA